MSQTTEDRIRAHYKATKRRVFRGEGGRASMGMVFMQLARRWQRPVREIKRIVGYRGM